MKAPAEHPLWQGWLAGLVSLKTLYLSAHRWVAAQQEEREARKARLAKEQGDE